MKKKPRKDNPIARRIRAPKANKWDMAHKFGKIAVIFAEAGITIGTGVPTLGLGEKTYDMIQAPVQKRILQFLKQVDLDIDRLNLEVKALSGNDLFLTALVQGLQIAMRNHQPEKLDALRTAVLNSAIPHYIEDDLALMFLHLIDIFGVWHMRVLNHVKSGIQSVYMDYSLQDERAEMYIITNQLKDKFPGDSFDAEFLVQVFKELSDHGLAQVKEVTQTDEGEMPVKATITNLGEKFLDFITTVRL
jgi:hypothetical protein